MPEPTTAQHVDRITAAGRELADALTAASEAGVSHALILPQLLLVFRGAFGELPPAIAGQLGGLLG